MAECAKGEARIDFAFRAEWIHGFSAETPRRRPRKRRVSFGFRCHAATTERRPGELGEAVMTYRYSPPPRCHGGHGRKPVTLSQLGLYLLACLAMTVLATMVPRSASATGKVRPCGTVRIDYRPTPSEHYTQMYISAPRSVRCRVARRLMQRYRDGGGGGPLTCRGSGAVCVYPDGWTCDAATPGQWPIIQECLRHEARIFGKVKSRIRGPR